MSTNLPPAEPGDEDDQHWFALMAGHSAPEADARTRADAAWLRAALLAYRVQAPAGSPSAPEQRAHRLLQRAQAAGLLHAGPGTASTASGGHRWRRWLAGLGRFAPGAAPWGWAVAVGLGGLALAMQLNRHGGPLGVSDARELPAHEVLRGNSLQQLQVADPLIERERLLAGLRAAGLEVAPFERLGRAGLDIVLPVPLPAAQARVLRQLGLQPPGGPALQVELLRAAPGAASGAAPAPAAR